MIRLKDIESALILFEDAAFKHAEATEIGDYKTANKCYDKIVKAVNYLKQQDEVVSLVKLLDHSYMGVRMWAATYLLPVKEDLALKVLKNIAENEGIHSLTADITLKEWRKGNLNL